MAFPYHHHHRRDDDDDGEPRYPPPGSRPPYSDPPPPTVPHVLHSHYNEAPPPSYVAHHSNYHPEPSLPDFDYSSGPPPTIHHHSHFPSVIHQHSHPSDSAFSNRPTVKVFAKANPNFSLSIRDGKVVLVPSDPYDPAQHWFKDEKYSTRIKDEEGCPCFALVNKATGQAMKHSVGDTHPVQLIRYDYDPDVVDESVLWTQSKEFGEGYRAIRMVNNIHLNVDAFNGDKYSGGVRDGTHIVLWKWNQGDNKLWKIIPYYNIEHSPITSLREDHIPEREETPLKSATQQIVVSTENNITVQHPLNSTNELITTATESLEAFDQSTGEKPISSIDNISFSAPAHSEVVRDNAHERINDCVPVEHSVEVIDVVKPLRRSTREHKPPSYLSDYHCNLLAGSHKVNSCAHPIEDYLSYTKFSVPQQHFLMNVSIAFEPTYFHQAVQYDHWKRAMDEEIAAVERTNTLNLVPLPTNHHAIGCKWVYKVKHKSDGSIERHKARLVAKGYNQQEGVDYLDTFSPVAKIVSFKEDGMKRVKEINKIKRCNFDRLLISLPAVSNRTLHLSSTAIISKRVWPIQINILRCPLCLLLLPNYNMDCNGYPVRQFALIHIYGCYFNHSFFF